MPTMLYTVLYLAIVWAGPRLMKNREPFRLTWALIPYNLSMAALNFYIASEVSALRLIDWVATGTHTAQAQYQ
jgi:elongation of very long chain fatty acids protein 4